MCRDCWIAAFFLGSRTMSDPGKKFSAEKVARLARIDFPQISMAQVQTQLDEILTYVDQLNELDLTGVKPFFGAFDSNHALRSDEIRTSLSREEVLANSPKNDGEFYLVPPVFGQ